MPPEAATTALAAEEPAAAAPAEEPEPELRVGLAAVEEIEVLLHICSFLGPSSLGRLACVSSSFGRKVEWSSTRCRTNGDVQRLSDQPGDELWSLVDEAAMIELGPPAVICRRCAAAMVRFSFRCNECGAWDSAAALGERTEPASGSDLRSAVDLPA